MRRRHFVKKFGQGLSTSLISPGFLRNGKKSNIRFDYRYPVPQTLNQLTQVIRAKDRMEPILSFSYQVEKGRFDPEAWNGGFLWVEGYHQSHLMLNHVYAIGRAHRSIGGSYSGSGFTGYTFFDIYDGSSSWNDVRINLKNDFERSGSARSFKDLLLEKVVVSFGVWTINKGFNQEAGIYITNVDLNFSEYSEGEASLLNKRLIQPLAKDKIWDRPNQNIAGEHHYVNQEEVYPY